MFNVPPLDHQGQPRFEQQMPFRPAQAQNVRVINNPARISDLTPEPVLTDEYCQRKLTSYEACTLRKSEPLIPREPREENRRDHKSSKNSKKSRTESPKPSWIRVDITQEHFDQVDIKKKIKVLDKVKSVTERKKELRSHQASQVTKLLEGKIARESDNSFTWTLAQLERKVSKSQTESITIYLKRALRPHLNAIIVFQNSERLKMEPARPLPPPPPPPPPQFQVPVMDRQFEGNMPTGPVKASPRFQAPAMDRQFEGNMPTGPVRASPKFQAPVMDRQFEGNMPTGPVRANPKFPPDSREPMAPKVEIVQPRSNGIAQRGKSGGNPSPEMIDITAEIRRPKSPGTMSRMRGSGRRRGEGYNSDNSSANYSSESESDSEAIYTDSDTTPSTAGSRRERRESSRHRREDMGHRMHEKGSYAVETRRRQSSTAYVPDPPQHRNHALSREQTALSSIGVRPEIAESFAAGVVAATRAAIVDQFPLPPPRTTRYDDRSTRSHRSSQDSNDGNIIRIQENMRSHNEFHSRNKIPSFRARNDLSLRDEARINGNIRAHEHHRKLDELRATQDKIRAREITLDELRARGDFGPMDDLGPRDGFGPRGGFGPRDDLGLRDGYGPRDDFEPRNDLRTRVTYMDSNLLRDEDDELYPRRENALPPFPRHGSLPLPRHRPLPFSPRGAMGVPLPLDSDRPYEYIRNPFASRRRESMY
jgi:hypothetical protein